MELDAYRAQQCELQQMQLRLLADILGALTHRQNPQVSDRGLPWWTDSSGDKQIASDTAVGFGTQTNLWSGSSAGEKYRSIEVKAPRDAAIRILRAPPINVGDTVTPSQIMDLGAGAVADFVLPATDNLYARTIEAPVGRFDDIEMRVTECPVPETRLFPFSSRTAGGALGTVPLAIPPQGALQYWLASDVGGTFTLARGATTVWTAAYVAATPPLGPFGGLSSDYTLTFTFGAAGGTAWASYVVQFG